MEGVVDKWSAQEISWHHIPHFASSKGQRVGYDAMRSLGTVYNTLPFYALEAMGQEFRARFQIGTVVTPNESSGMITSAKETEKCL